MSILQLTLMKGVSKISDHTWCEFIYQSVKELVHIYKIVHTIKTCNFNSLYTHHGGKCNNEFLWKQTSWCPKCLLIPKNKCNLFNTKKEIKTTCIRLWTLYKEQGMCVGLLVPSIKLQSVSYNTEVMLS